MPAAFQGTLFRSTGDPIVDLKPQAGVTPADQRARLDALAKLNELDMQKFPGNSELAARISSYELAYRMQGCAPEALDVTKESEATRKLYGLDEKVTEPFGRQCLMARRLVEHGVRFVQLFHGGMGNQNTDTWDAHGDIKGNHTQHAAETDRFDAIICLGCLIRGETPHMEFIAAAVADGLAAAAGATGVPMTFGVLTTNSVEEAIARAGDGPSNKGHEAAAAAIEMASVIAQLTRPPAAS